MCVTLLALALGIASQDTDAFQQTRVAMCQAVVREMHIEIHKHSLRKNGEDDIYETVPAICLAIVQNYTITATPAPHMTWVLSKRTVKLDDDDDPDPGALQHLMLLKGACEAFTDEFQQEMSELMYRAALQNDVEPIVAEFCTSSAVVNAPLPPPPPRKRKPKDPTGASHAKKARKKAIESHSDGGMPDMSDLLKKYDTDGSISTLLEMERENPQAMLEPEQLAQVQRGSVDIQCDVCSAAAKVGVVRARKARVLADETALASIVSLLCYGSPPDSMDEYPKYPGNPPLWGEMYTVTYEEGSTATASDRPVGDDSRRAAGAWRMRKLPKGAPTEEQGGGGKEHHELVMKHAMISRACKQVPLQPMVPSWTLMVHPHEP